MPDDREAEPMLDVARGDQALSRHLRRSLGVLRDRTDDEEFRRQLDDVLAGRLSLREAARTGIFERGLTPHFDQGMRRWRELSEEERARLARDGEAAFDRLNAEERPVTPAPPPAGHPKAPGTAMPTVQDADWFPPA